MWEEGVRIYDIPGVPNNFPFFSYLTPQKVTSSILPIHFTKHPAAVDLF